MTFSIFFKPHTSVAFPHSRRSWPDEYSDKTIVNRPTFKAIYREFDIALFFCFFFTSHCDWFRKHESRMAFLLQEPRKKANCVCSTIKLKESCYIIICFLCFYRLLPNKATRAVNFFFEFTLIKELTTSSSSLVLLSFPFLVLNYYNGHLNPQ